MQGSESSEMKFLTAPGELGKRIQAYDWARTPLGPIGQWPQSLKTAISLMLSSRQPMWIGWGPDATFLYNDAYIDVLGQEKHGWALGRPAAQVWSEIWDICGPLSDIVLKQGDATVAEDVRLFMNRGGFLEETFYSFSYSPIRDESGNVAGLFCPNLDVTSKHLNERRLRALSELATKSLVEKTVERAAERGMQALATNPDDVPFALLYLCDAEGAEASLVQCIGLDDPAALVAQWVDVTGREPARPWPIAAVIRTAQEQEVAVDHLPGLPTGLAGQPVTQAVALPILATAQDRAIGVLVVGINAARKLDAGYRSFLRLIATQVATAINNARIAEKAKLHVDMLAELDRAKTDFFSNVSHEFRTPLTLMLGPIEEALADQEHRLPPIQEERMQLMQRNALRLQKLVNSLLEFSRTQAGRAEAAFVRTDLSALTTDLAGSFRSTIEHAHMQLLVDCPPLQDTYYVDPGMWEKIVLNLLSNAFKFTLQGSIRIALAEKDNQAVLTVADTGVGIARHELPRLFERFHRIDGSPGRTHEGSGFGLALVQDLVHLLGARISVESELGIGTTFVITIAAGTAHLDQRQLQAAAAAPRVKAAAVGSYLAEA